MKNTRMRGTERRDHAPPVGDALLSVWEREFAERAARCADPVILYGETGSGKTFLARYIHDCSVRAGQPFVRVNCAAIPETLFEREMFGHVRGAFTDARDAADGFISAANGGTLFLDEIGEMPLQVQPKLLAVLEEGLYRRLGSPQELRADIRFISATNCDLGEMIARKQFRQDLFYRCSVLQHRLRPLRERASELAPIVSHLLHRNLPPGSVSPAITQEALEILRAHSWPGNLRELENVLRGAMLVAMGEAIQSKHLLESVVGLRASPSVVGSGSRRYTAPDTPGLELEMIRDALRREKGNKTRAARRLGMSRAALWIKLQRYASELAADSMESDPTEPGQERLRGDV